jgi:hypothetical protein
VTFSVLNFGASVFCRCAYFFAATPFASGYISPSADGKGARLERERLVLSGERMLDGNKEELIL